MADNKVDYDPNDPKWRAGVEAAISWIYQHAPLRQDVRKNIRDSIRIDLLPAPPTLLEVVAAGLGQKHSYTEMADRLRSLASHAAVSLPEFDALHVIADWLVARDAALRAAVEHKNAGRCNYCGKSLSGTNLTQCAACADEMGP